MLCQSRSDEQLKPNIISRQHMKTLAFTENMRDAYSDTIHLDNCLKSVDTGELDNSVFEKRVGPLLKL